MAKRTGSTVGPGSYQIAKVIDNLKKKPCMAKLAQTFLKNEDRYEIVNNIRVLQPKYLRGTEKFVFERNMEKL
jgi:hypothetical protein